MGSKFVTVDVAELGSLLEAAAPKATALPDGSFPITDEGDVKNAVQAIGRAKDPAAAKAHIKKMAAKLGCTDCIPTTWQEAATVEPVELVETGDLIEARGGTALIKVIGAGQGTSGTYTKSVLARDAPKAFPPGTHMYWNHPTVTEAFERPERDLRDLAAVTTGTATWQDNGPAGPGVYAPVQVMEQYRRPLKELASHIGVSIRASGRKNSETGMVESIDHGHSIDYVTRAGAGGEIVSLFEAARAAIATKPLEGDMELTEALARNTTLEGELTEARALGTFAAAERDTLRAENERLKEAAELRTLKEAAAGKLGELMALSPFDLSAKSQARILAETLRDPKARDDDKLVEALAAHAQSEIDVLLEYGVLDAGGNVTGLGGGSGPFGAAPDPVKLEEKRAAAYELMGLTPEQAKVAAQSR